MKLLVVLSAMSAGGAERVVSILANAWSDAGHGVTVVTFEADGTRDYHPLDERVRRCRLGIQAPGSARWGRLSRLVRRVRALRACIRGEQPDLVISFLTKINVCTLIAARPFRAPVIICERNNPLLQHSARGWLILQRLLGRSATMILQTEEIGRSLHVGPGERVFTIPNPVQIPADAAPQLPSRFVAAGRLDRQKGFDLLVDAFARVADQRRDWSLIIWGEGPERERLLAHAARLGLRDRVLLPGLSPAPMGWIGSGSVFILSSRYEGFPNVLVEAMAAGLPSISFACPFGPREIIRSSDEGLLVPSGDIDRLAGAMLRLSGDEALRIRLSAAAREATRRYAANDILLRWDEAFRAAIGRSAGGGEPAPPPIDARMASLPDSR